MTDGNHIFELVKRAQDKGFLCQAGWRRNFIDCYIDDYEWSLWNTFTSDEIKELKSFQADMRKALDAIEEMRYERYQSGQITREDVVRLLDYRIAKDAEQWGEDYIYTRWSKEHKQKVLYVYDNKFEPVQICKIDYRYDNGYDYETVLFTDGSTRTYMYGAY